MAEDGTQIARKAIDDGTGVIANVEIWESDDGAICFRSKDPRQLAFVNNVFSRENPYGVYPREGGGGSEIRIYPTSALDAMDELRREDEEEEADG